MSGVHGFFDLEWKDAKAVIEILIELNRTSFLATECDDL